MFGKDAILHYFEQKNIKNLFHLPGIHTLPLDERAAKSPIRFILGRHELNLAFMADGYARATGETGVLIVTPGPGLGNVVSGCMEAYSADVPLLIVHIDTGRKDIGKGILHELEEPEAIFAGFTKKTFCVSRVEDLVPLLDEAYRLAGTERKGPVVISIPYTFFEKEVPFRLSPVEDRQEKPQMDGIIEVLARKERPVIIGGSALMKEGVSATLEALCDEAGIPVLTTTAGKGAVSEGSPWAFGNIMQRGTARRIIESADVVVALGTRLRDVDAKRRGVKIKELIHIDTDDAWIGRNYGTAHGASGDMGVAVEALYTGLKGTHFRWDLAGLKKAREEERRSLEADSVGFKALKFIRDVIPEETTTVWDLSLLGYWAEYYFPVYHPRTFLMPRGISPIFYAFPAGIGAKAGRPERPCLVVCGDGSFLPTAAELATVKQYGIPLVILIYNNGSYGILDDYMDASYGMKGSMGLVNPDFVKLAKSFDIKAKRVKTLAQLKDVFLRRVNWDEAVVVDFQFPLFPPPWK